MEPHPPPRLHFKTAGRALEKYDKSTIDTKVKLSLNGIESPQVGASRPFLMFG